MRQKDLETSMHVLEELGEIEGIPCSKDTRSWTHVRVSKLAGHEDLLKLNCDSFRPLFLDCHIKLQINIDSL